MSWYCWMCAQAGEDLHVWGTGSPLRQFIYNVDLGSLMVRTVREFYPIPVRYRRHQCGASIHSASRIIRGKLSYYPWKKWAHWANLNILFRWFDERRCAASIWNVRYLGVGCNAGVDDAELPLGGPHHPLCRRRRRSFHRWRSQDDSIRDELWGERGLRYGQGMVTS